jgi:type III secretory pathway lipoprotein EscJ
LGRELEATLATATGVERARVHLALPPPEPLVGSAPQEPGKAFVLLQHAPGKAPWQEHEVRELVAGAVAGLTPERVRVVFQEVPPPTRTESSEPAWESVGPLRVERDSARQLRWLLGVFSASGLLLVGALGALWWRLRLSLRQPDREPSGPWAVRTRVPPAP